MSKEIMTEDGSIYKDIPRYEFTCENCGEETELEFICETCKMCFSCCEECGCHREDD